MVDVASQQWTVLKLLNWTREYFERGGIDSPRLAAEVLLAHVLGCRRIELYARFDYQPDETVRAKFRELVKRAAANEPIAYLVGYKEFYSLRFGVTDAVLIPRCETEILVTEAIAHLKNLGRCGKLWDICTGSGCVAVATACQVSDVTVLATDISEQAIAVAEQNAADLNAADRITFRKTDLLTLPEDWRESKEFDIITANPPYVADDDPVGESVRHEPRLALYAGKDGLDCIRAIVSRAPEFLKPAGALIMEFGYQQAEQVRDLIVSSGAFHEPKIIRDHQEIQRAAVAIRN